MANDPIPIGRRAPQVIGAEEEPSDPNVLLRGLVREWRDARAAMVAGNVPQDWARYDRAVEALRKFAETL